LLDWLSHDRLSDLVERAGHIVGAGGKSSRWIVLSERCG
jgi:hypothetical protein